jgi:hypothetical protein
MRRTQPVLLIHEPKPYWAPLLQWEFVENRELDVQSVPHRIDLPSRLELPAVVGCLLVLGADAHEDLLQILIHYAGRRHFFLLADQVPLDLEWSLREAGACSFLESSIPVSQCVRILRKRLQSGSSKSRI